MLKGIMTSHVREEGFRGTLVLSLIGHLLLFLFFFFAVDLGPQGEPLVVGSGAGGGKGGDIVTVGLSAELSGGTGMVKPSVIPRPAAVLPPPQPQEPERTAPEKEEVFVQEPSAKETVRQTSTSQRTPENSAVAPAPGQIPRQPDPGSGGPGSQSLGSGGGFGGGQGVTIGQGTGEGAMDSWYVRQVEQRVGLNWLKTSLGRLDHPVQTVISFEIQPDGTIENIQIEQRSGIATVDLAAERAVQACNPLSPLPSEFRHRKVKFVAYFEYPPR